MTTFMANSSTVQPQWLLIDANGKTLGRLASVVASRLRGKNKPSYTPHVDVGDFIVIVNADKVVVTGNKAQDKQYHRHTGYMGGIKTTNFAKMQATHPSRAIEIAVKGMLPKGPLGRAMYRKMKVYAGDQHPHAAQCPQKIDV